MSAEQITNLLLIVLGTLCLAAIAFAIALAIWATALVLKVERELNIQHRLRDRAARWAPDGRPYRERL